MNKLSWDTCRCHDNGCKEREDCLRYTDVPPDLVRYSWANSLYNPEAGPLCAFKITLEMWESK